MAVVIGCANSGYEYEGFVYLLYVLLFYVLSCYAPVYAWLLQTCIGTYSPQLISVWGGEENWTVYLIFLEKWHSNFSEDSGNNILNDLVKRLSRLAAIKQCLFAVEFGPFVTVSLMVKWFAVKKLEPDTGKWPQEILCETTIRTLLSAHSRHWMSQGSKQWAGCWLMRM